MSPAQFNRGRVTELSDFFHGHSTARLSVANALIDGGQVVEVNPTGFRHIFTVARIGWWRKPVIR